MIFSQKTNYVLGQRSDGKERWRERARKSRNLILMDIVMPRMTGLEVLASPEERQGDGKETGHLADDAREDIRCRRDTPAGAATILQKPVNDVELLELLKAYLGE